MGHIRTMHAEGGAAKTVGVLTATGLSGAPGEFAEIENMTAETGKQSKSGLGIEAQRQVVANCLNGGNWRIIAEFTEVERGKRSGRPALGKALAAARVRQVPLVVAKVARLARSVAFLSRLLEARPICR